jgi:hypothetical protein
MNPVRDRRKGARIKQDAAETGTEEMQLDHLAVTCADLDTGADWLADRLGVAPGPGGRHEHFGTWNRLISLGPGLYLEVIAPDPAVPAPVRPRWFGLDRAGAPALGNWIVRRDSLDGLPPEAGQPVALSRGDLSWTIAVPADGSLPLEGGFPTVIAWGAGVAHPSTRLPDHGLRLISLTVSHPGADGIAAGLRAELDDPRVRFRAAAPGLTAVIATPRGEVTLP